MNAKDFGRWAKEQRASLSDNERLQARNLGDKVFNRFISELNTSTGYGSPSVVSPALTVEDVLDRFCPLARFSPAILEDLEFHIRKAGDTGDWKVAVLLGIIYGQVGIELALNEIVVRRRFKAVNSGAVGGKVKAAKRLSLVSSRDEKLRALWHRYKKTYKNPSIERFWNHITQLQYFEIKKSEPQFAKQLKPRRRFLSLETVRIIVRAKPGAEANVVVTYPFQT